MTYGHLTLRSAAGCALRRPGSVVKKGTETGTTPEPIGAGEPDDPRRDTGPIVRAVGRATGARLDGMAVEAARGPSAGPNTGSWVLGASDPWMGRQRGLGPLAGADLPGDHATRPPRGATRHEAM